MKTIEEIAGNINHFTKECDPHKLNYGRIINILKKFESEIRKDQDKITRHACAENYSKTPLEFRVWDVQNKFYGKLTMLMIMDEDHVEVDYEGHMKEPRRVCPEEVIIEQRVNGEWVPVTF